jgi:YjjG family noncanonical pyrimidine nucleotidase
LKEFGYKCILFDLDHTLWDYETNCAEALKELYEKYQLKEKGVSSVTDLITVFRQLNNELWDQYDRGIIQRDIIRLQRFHRVLLTLGVDDYPFSLTLSHAYVSLSPTKKNLMPNAKETLSYLSDRYELMVITNGFESIQSVKLASSGIDSYFSHLITSERVGFKKPSREIFDHALSKGKFQPYEAFMIGDNLLTDIRGAKNSAIDHAYYNPAKATHREEVTHEISDLSQLKMIL